MKRTTMPMPALMFMHPGNPHGLRFADGDGGEGGSGGDGTGSGDGGEGAAQVNEYGYPNNTPVADMTAEQQASYWKRQSRKHETNATARADYEAIKAERDQLKQAGMSADEKAVQEARDQAAAEARADERSKWSARTVQAELRAALKGKVHVPKGKNEAEVVNAIIGPLSPQHFLTDDGEVDADKVTAYASGFGGVAAPDMGQGNRGPAGKKSLASATEDARSRREKKTN